MLFYFLKLYTILFHSLTHFYLYIFQRYIILDCLIELCNVLWYIYIYTCFVMFYHIILFYIYYIIMFDYNKSFCISLYCILLVYFVLFYVISYYISFLFLLFYFTIFYFISCLYYYISYFVLIYVFHVCFLY